MTLYNIIKNILYMYPIKEVVRVVDNTILTLTSDAKGVVGLVRQGLICVKFVYLSEKKYGILSKTWKTNNTVL